MSGGALLLDGCASVEPYKIPLNGVEAGTQMLFEEQDNHGQELCGHSATDATVGDHHLSGLLAALEERMRDSLRL